MTLEDVLKLETPDDLWRWMHNNIRYGWTNKQGEFREFNDDRKLSEYYFHDPKETVERKSGICGDQVLLEKAWFDYHNIENHVITFGYLDKDNKRIGGGHTFLYYKLNDKYYYFENAFSPCANIIEYDNEDELIGTQIGVYLAVVGSNNIYVINDELTVNNTTQDAYISELKKEDIYPSIKDYVDKGINKFSM